MSARKSKAAKCTCGFAEPDAGDAVHAVTCTYKVRTPANLVADFITRGMRAQVRTPANLVADFITRGMRAQQAADAAARDYVGTGCDWYCDSCNAMATGSRDTPPADWKLVFTTKKATIPWGTCCPTCAAKIVRKGGRAE